MSAEMSALFLTLLELNIDISKIKTTLFYKLNLTFGTYKIRLLLFLKVNRVKKVKFRYFSVKIWK